LKIEHRKFNEQKHLSGIPVPRKYTQLNCKGKFAPLEPRRYFNLNFSRMPLIETEKIYRFTNCQIVIVKRFYGRLIFPRGIGTLSQTLHTQDIFLSIKCNSAKWNVPGLQEFPSVL